MPKSQIPPVVLKTLKGLLVAGLLGVVGCRTTHNQTIIPQEWQSYFNAKPVATDFQNINNQHKVLVAVIDSGTDYNHPLLKENIHYTLNSEGVAIGTGWDFVGNDSWPLPYLARTKYLYNKEKSVQEEEKNTLKNIKFLIKITPDLARWLHPHRHLDDEGMVSIYHGTHVAGLASYDDTRIGIVPYRIMPDQENLDGEYHEMLEVFYGDLESAIKKANKAGVKVVNMSLGVDFDLSGAKAELLSKLFKKFEILVNSYPDMVFVAAAGNDKTWVDGETRFSFPCGIKAENMLCVASIGKKGTPSPFTNIPLVDSPLVFAPGEKILGPIPSLFCPSNDLSSLSEKFQSDELEKISHQLLKDCPVNQRSPMKSLDGTSMASGIISRLIAQEIVETKAANLSAREIIQTFIQDKGQQTKIGPLTIYKIQAPLPSWYPKNTTSQDEGLSESTSNGYFEFITVRQDSSL